MRSALLAFALALVACTSSTTPKQAPAAKANASADPDDPTTAGDYHGTFTSIPDPNAGGLTYGQATCKRMFRCDPITSLAQFTSVDSCAKVMDARFAPTLNAPNTLLVIQLEQCIVDLNLSTCDEPVDCGFVGETILGDPCSVDAQCVDGFCHVDSAASTCGTCVSAGVPLGGDCSINKCGDGTCDPGTKLCTHVDPTDPPAYTTAKAGEACAASTVCLNGVCTDGVCVGNIPLGGQCGDIVSGTNCADQGVCGANDTCIPAPMPIHACK